MEMAHPENRKPFGVFSARLLASSSKTTLAVLTSEKLKHTVHIVKSMSFDNCYPSKVVNRS
jgi:hypothetical protein